MQHVPALITIVESRKMRLLHSYTLMRKTVEALADPCLSLNYKDI